jgi:hypothetical protein
LNGTTKCFPSVAGSRGQNLLAQGTELLKNNDGTNLSRSISYLVNNLCFIASSFMSLIEGNIMQNVKVCIDGNLMSHTEGNCGTEVRV